MDELTPAPPFFTVPRALPALEALQHASHLLKCSNAITYELTDSADDQRELAWAVLHLVDHARLLIEAAAGETV